MQESIEFRPLELRPLAIDWQGPFTIDDIRTKTDNPDAGLYQVYGCHPIFGFNSLSYVGKTERGRFGYRLIQHWENSVQISLSDASFRIGYLNEKYYRHDDDWEEWAGLLGDAEALTIYLHSPPCNSNFVGAYSGRPLQIYNWGQRGSLLMQYASHFQTAHPNGDWEAF